MDENSIQKSICVSAINNEGVEWEISGVESTVILEIIEKLLPVGRNAIYDITVWNESGKGPDMWLSLKSKAFNDIKTVLRRI